MSELSDRLYGQIVEAGLPLPETEYYFAKPWRRWRFDFCWPDRKLAVEVEGGQFIRGRHNRPGGFSGDAQKYNAAALLGWTLLRFPTSWVDSGEACRWTAFVLRNDPRHAGTVGLFKSRPRSPSKRPRSLPKPAKGQIRQIS